MEINKRNVWFGVLIILILWGLSGFIIYLLFSEPEERGTFGDMFGVVNALFSGLALFGIIVSILIQQKELNLQRQELADTREEFKTNRITNILFKQVEYLNNSIDKIRFYKLGSMSQTSLEELIKNLENYKKGNNTSYLSLHDKNLESLIYLTSKVLPIIKNFEKLLTKSKFNSEEIQSLKELFSSNINQSLFEVYFYFKDWVENKHKTIELIRDEDIKALELENMNILEDRINYILRYDIIEE